MIEWLPWLSSKSCYTNLKFFETLKDTPNSSKGFRFVAFLVLEMLGGPFRPPLVLGVGTKTLGARRVKNFETMTAINASRDILNNSNLLAFLHKCDTMNYVRSNYAILSDVFLK